MRKNEERAVTLGFLTMAETPVDGASHRRFAGDWSNRTKQNHSPPPLSPRDLISALPDALIHHIFSFLTLPDVVQTSVLSRRWRSTWRATTDLVLDGCSPSLLDSVLGQCISPTVKRFHITYLIYDEADRSKVDLSLRFAVLRRVEDLCFCLPDKSQSIYELPEFLYCLSSLVRLKIGMCRFSLGATVRWPCLKVLSILNVELSDDFLGRIFEKSPVLESLELGACWGVKNLRIDSLSLKRLVLRGLSICNSSYVEKIWAPHLLSLRVKGQYAAFRLDDVSSLVEVELDLFIGSSGSASKGCDSLVELLDKLRGVSTITLNGCCLQVQARCFLLFKCNRVECVL